MKFGSRLPDSEPELNLIPLIDVIFVLIIFFVATTTFNQRSTMKLQLPTAQAIS
ncbi:MAG: ExbD/TolR family protein, partial [Arenimonas sp.]